LFLNGQQRETNKNLHVDDQMKSIISLVTYLIVDLSNMKPCVYVQHHTDLVWMMKNKYVKPFVYYVLLSICFFALLLNGGFCLSGEITNNVTDDSLNDNELTATKNAQDSVSDNDMFSHLFDKRYHVKCRLCQLNEIHRILPKSKDVIGDTSEMSSNYGLVRPLLREIYLDGQDSLLELIEYFDNKNYLYSKESIVSIADFFAPHEEVIREVTLGEEAQKLFENIIDPTNVNYKFRHDKEGKSHVRSSFLSVKFKNKDRNDIKKWCQNKSLLEIQQEVVDFYIQREKKIGFHEKDSEKIYLAPLLKIRDKLPIIRTKYLVLPPMPSSCKQIKIEQKAEP
jgi:hypothetical protein